EPVRRVVRGVDRADRLARRAAAVLAEHRQEPDRPFLALLGVWEVALDAQPGQVPATPGLVRPGDPDVVLRVARGHAGAAPGAAVEVDHHPPPRLVGRVLAVVRAGRRVVGGRGAHVVDRPESADALELIDHGL